MPKTTTIKAKNNTGSDLTAGKLVYSSGYDPNTGYIFIGLADNRSLDAMPAIGVLCEDATNGAENLKVRTLGPCAGFDTATISNNARVYVGKNGNITTTKPHEINGSLYTQQIGTVLDRKEYPYGQIQVLPQDIEQKVSHSQLKDVTSDQHHTENHEWRHQKNAPDDIGRSFVEGSGDTGAIARWEDEHRIGATGVYITSDGQINADTMQQYMSVTYTLNNIAQTGLHTLFNTTNYGGFVTYNAANGITYNPSTGRFRVLKNGIYLVSATLFFITNATNTLSTFRIFKNNSQNVWDASTAINVHSLVDPMTFAINVILPLLGGDTLEINAQTSLSSILMTLAGSTFNMIKYA